MKLYLILTIFILSSLCAQAQETKKYTSKDGKFAIGFPATPKITKETTKIKHSYHVGNGKDTTLVYSIKTTVIRLRKNDFLYQVSYFDVPDSFADTLTKEQIHTLLDGAEDANPPKSTLLGTFNLKLLGYYGKEHRLKLWRETEQFLRIRLYWIKNRVYIVSVNTTKENDFHINLTDYFDSFDLLDTPINPKAEIENPDIKSPKFTVKFPQASKIKEVEAPISSGLLKIITYGCEPNFINDNNMAYIVGTMQYVTDIEQTKNFNLEQFYNEALNQFLGKDLTLISKKMIEIKGQRMLEAKTLYKKQQLIIKQRILIKGDMMYTIQAVTKLKNDENKEMNNFLDSFSLKE